MKRRQPKFYFSFRSPYSWMGAKLLEERLGAETQSIQYVPFFEPDETSTALLLERGERFVYTPMTREKHLYILQDVKRLTHKFGYSMTWPIDREPHWEVSHLG